MFEPFSIRDVRLGGKNKMHNLSSNPNFLATSLSSKSLWALQLSMINKALKFPCVFKWCGQKTVFIPQTVIFCVNQAFFWSA